jgi:tetratricopeptide (TPR) repeat protein
LNFENIVLLIVFIALVSYFIRSLKRAIILADSFDAPRLNDDTDEHNTNKNTIEKSLLKTKYAGITKFTEEHFLERAQTATEKNLHATAKSFYTKAIQLNQHPHYYMMRAFSNSITFNFGESIEDVGFAILLEPTNSFYYKFKGDLLLRALQVPEAIEAYKQAHEMGEADLGYVIIDLQNRKNAWLAGAEYLDHFYIEYWYDYYSTKNDIEHFKTKLSLLIGSSADSEKLALNKFDIGCFSFNQRITYLNMSSYKLFLN